MCLFSAEDLLRSCRSTSVVFWRLSFSLSFSLRLFVCLSEEEKSPFLIFLVFLLCVMSSLSPPTKTLKDE